MQLLPPSYMVTVEWSTSLDSPSKKDLQTIISVDRSFRHDVGYSYYIDPNMWQATLKTCDRHVDCCSLCSPAWMTNNNVGLLAEVLPNALSLSRSIGRSFSSLLSLLPKWTIVVSQTDGSLTVGTNFCHTDAAVTDRFWFTFMSSRKSRFVFRFNPDELPINTLKYVTQLPPYSIFVNSVYFLLFSFSRLNLSTTWLSWWLTA